jgi:hypothetical protein
MRPVAIWERDGRRRRGAVPRGCGRPGPLSIQAPSDHHARHDDRLNSTLACQLLHHLPVRRRLYPEMAVDATANQTPPCVLSQDLWGRRFCAYQSVVVTGWRGVRGICQPARRRARSTTSSM